MNESRFCSGVAKTFLLFAIVSFLSITSISAQTTGTIKGTVTDRETGEPLPLVNVVVKGTNTGAATDERGE